MKLDAPGRLFVAMKSKGMNRLPPQIQRRLIPVTDWNQKRNNLFVERDNTPAMAGIEPLEIQPIGR
jgi:hypothetical protein